MADSKKQSSDDQPRQQPRVEIERTRFKSFLLQNPNYFGNLEVSDFKPIKVIKGNTTFEQMVCVGLNPPYDRLEAVVQIKSGQRLRRRHLRSRIARIRPVLRGPVRQRRMARRRRLERPRLRHPRREAHLLCRPPRLQLVQEILPLRKHREGPRDPAVERAAARQFAQLHAGVGQRRQRAGADSSAQVLPVGRARQGVRTKSPSSFPIRSARSSRVWIRPSS